MERSLTELELSPADPQLLSEIFRSVHTIKGTTGFLGFHRLESLAHKGENLLGLLREGKAAATPDVITLLLRVLDGLRVILGQIEANGTDGEPEPDLDGVLIAELNQRTEAASNGTQPVKAEEKPASVFAQAVTQAVKAADNVKARMGKKSKSKKKTQAPTEAVPEPIEVAAPTAVDGPMLVGQPVLVEKQAVVEVAKPAEVETALVQNRRAGDAPAAAESTLRVDVELLNRMMNLVGELVLTRNQILQHNSSDHGFSTLARRLDMVTADLRESVMKARMQPVSNIFQKFPRMLRDLCQLCKKQVQLVMDGQETELDKSLLEAIKDPLTHAVRNSIDHGVETPDERVAAGKPAEGTLRLRAYQEGGHVVIEVADDGKGIDPKKIAGKAVEKGLISQERAAALSETEILQLIFLPGFSTAEKVTNVSGRGVGMDVVKTNVEKIGGKVELESTLGVGTTIRLRIPLTLAIIPALVVRSCGQAFAIPQSALFELVYVAANEVDKAIEWVGNSPVFRLRDTLLPVIRLGELLHLTAEQEMARSKFYMAVLDADGKRFGLVVDELLDPEEIVVKPLSSVLRQVGLFSGATILGNGSLALILDPTAAATQANVGLRKIAEEETLNAQAEAANKEPEYLVFEISRSGERGRRSALPLEMIERIETVTYDRIEYAGDTPVLQYLGGVLPLMDEGGLLYEHSGATAEEAANIPVHILVCHEADWMAGLVVREVVDVKRGKIFEANGDGQNSSMYDPKIARIGDRVTTLQNIEPLRMLSFNKHVRAQNTFEHREVA